MSNLLKKAILSYRTKANIKKRSLAQNVNFEESTNIALFYSDRFEDEKGVETLIKELEAAGKTVNILVFCHNQKTITTTRLHLSVEDVSLAGTIKKKAVSSFLAQSYDFALCLDHTNHFVVNYIVSMIDARCRVGITHPDRKNLFEMIVLADKKETDLCCDVLKYLKMIKTYEN